MNKFNKVFNLIMEDLYSFPKDMKDDVDIVVKGQIEDNPQLDTRSFQDRALSRNKDQQQGSFTKRSSYIKRNIDKIPTKQLYTLVNDSNSNIREYIAFRKDLPIDIMQKLSNDKYLNVVWQLSKRTDLPEQIKQKLINSNFLDVRMQMCLQPQLTDELADKLVNSFSTENKIRLLKWDDPISTKHKTFTYIPQKNVINVKILQRLAQDPSFKVRQLVANRENLPQSVIQKLSSDSSKSVRGNIEKLKQLNTKKAAEAQEQRKFNQLKQKIKSLTNEKDLKCKVFADEINDGYYDISVGLQNLITLPQPTNKDQQRIYDIVIKANRQHKPSVFLGYYDTVKANDLARIMNDKIKQPAKREARKNAALKYGLTQLAINFSE